MLPKKIEVMKNLKGVKSLYEKVFQGDNKVKLIVCIGVLGMVLILISSFTGKSKPVSEPEPTGTAEDYIVSMEKKLLNLVTSIEGVGRANVMVTMESGTQYVYAKEEKKNLDTTKDYSGEEEMTVVQKDNLEQRYILVDGGGGRKQALLETQLEPVVKGVVVVCEGAENPLVEQRIMNAVTTALAIPSNRVCVTKIHPQNQ